ncbi:hypothetical protein [Scytonema sp. NUACC26]|uniref:hypothetical protein n=1 Tax=Scytonema sp. NUACC26 TaxID=3140176 RepID=UPI0034DCB64F
MNYSGDRICKSTRVLLFLGLFPVLLASCFSSRSLAQEQLTGTDITSLTVKTTAGSVNSVSDVKGDSEFEGGTYNLNFLGLTQSIIEFSFNGGKATVNDAIPAKVYVRRKPYTDDRQLAWYFGTFNSSNNTFTFLAFGPLSQERLFSENNILAGFDNVFTNIGANVGGTFYNGNASIERVDFILHSSVEANDNTGFVVLERGAVTGHDGFGIAAITKVSPSGKPIGYGSVFIVPVNTWGKVPLVTPIPQTYFLNNIADGGTGTAQNPALTVPVGQTLGGVVIKTNQLVSPGQTIYGYSIFGPDVTCSSQELVNVKNSCFPSETKTEGGLDTPSVNLGAVKLQQGQ